MEAKCAKMPPRGSKLTEALKTWQNSLSKFAYLKLNLVKRKIQSRIRFLGIQLINITSGTESAISGVVDYKILIIW